MAELSPTIGMSGGFGTVDGLTAVGAWQITGHAAENRPTVNTRTLGGTDRWDGVIDWNGSYQQDRIAPAALTHMPGEFITFAGYPGPTNGIPGDSSSGLVVTSKAYLEQLQIDWNWETNDPVMMTTLMSGAGQYGIAGAPDGVLRQSAGNPYVDVGTGPYSINPVGSSIFIADYATPTDIGAVCVSRAQFTLRCPGVRFVNSCTYGLVGRRKGNIDWSLSLTMSQANLSAQVNSSTPFGLTPGRVVRVLLPATYDNSDNWELSFGMVRGTSNYVVSRKTREVISYNVDIEMCALDSLGQIGSIKLPGGATYWPYTTI